MEFVFLPLWCHLVNWGPAEADLVGFPGKIDLKMAHVGFSPCLACAASSQQGGSSGLAGSTRGEGWHWLLSVVDSAQCWHLAGK